MDIITNNPDMNSKNMIHCNQLRFRPQIPNFQTMRLITKSLIAIATFCHHLNATVVSLHTASSQYLTLNDQNKLIQGPFINSSENSIYSTAWNLEIQSDGAFMLSPVLTKSKGIIIAIPSNTSGSTGQNLLEIGDIGIESKWNILPAGESSYKIESRQNIGRYIGQLNQTNLILTKDPAKIITFTIIPTKIPKPLLFLVTDMSLYSFTPVNTSFTACLQILHKYVYIIHTNRYPIS